MSIRVGVSIRIPNSLLSQEAVRNAITDKMERKTKPDVKAMFEDTIQGWRNPPYFIGHVTDTPTHLQTSVYPSGSNAPFTGGTEPGAIYRLVNLGARSHEIEPRNATFLRFQPGYRAGTSPRVLRSHSFERFGGFVTASHVNHPGFEARDFDKQIAEEYEDTFHADMQDAIMNAVVRNNPGTTTYP